MFVAVVVAAILIIYLTWQTVIRDIPRKNTYSVLQGNAKSFKKYL